MAKRDMKQALGASLKAEEQAVRKRFEKAKTVRAKSASAPRDESRQEASSQVASDNVNFRDGDAELLSRIERRCRKAGIRADKREVLRAGLAALDAMRERELRRVFERLLRGKSGGREIRISIVHRANTVKFRRPFRIERPQATRRVIIGRRIATITM